MNVIKQLGSYRAGSVFRLYMGGHAIVSWLLMMTEPRALIRVVASTDAGIALIWILMLIGVAVIVDAVVNDFLPDRLHWRLAVRQRHFLLMAMAFCYVAQLYVAFSTLNSPGLMLSDLWNAAAIVFIAFVDAHQRSRDATCVVICS